MTNKELSKQVDAELRKRGQDGFSMAYLEQSSGLSGVGIEIQVGSSTFRNAWIIKGDEMPDDVADRAVEWMGGVRAAPEKFQAA